MIRPQPKPVRAPKRNRQPLKRIRWMVSKPPRRVTRPGPGSDPGYLQKVRGLECARPRISLDGESDLICEGDIVAHHAGPKSNDSTAVALCVKHHQQWHDGNGIFRRWRKVDRRNFAEALIDDTRRIIREGWSVPE